MTSSRVVGKCIGRKIGMLYNFVCFFFILGVMLFICVMAHTQDISGLGTKILIGHTV